MEKNEVKELLLNLIQNGDLKIILSGEDSYGTVTATAKLTLYKEAIMEVDEEMPVASDWGDDL